MLKRDENQASSRRDRLENSSITVKLTTHLNTDELSTVLNDSSY